MTTTRPDNGHRCPACHRQGVPLDAQGMQDYHQAPGGGRCTWTGRAAEPMGPTLTELMASHNWGWPT